ncbi:MAG: magnesium and cobalt transport protein CorA, partial [Rubrobacteraceae bacterium]
MIVDNAIYTDGRRTEPPPLEETLQVCRERDGFAWISLYEPTEEDLDTIAQDFGLHGLAVEDVIEAHQRSKLEHYGDSLFLVLKPAHYLEKPEAVEFSEVHVLLGRSFVLTVRHDRAPSLGAVRQRLESEPDLLRRGPAAVLYGVLDHIVDDYEPVVEELGNDIEEIEAEVFGERPDSSRRIYELSREVLALRRAVHPLAGMLEHLTKENSFDADAEILRHLRDVHDHALRTAEQIDGFRELLSNILNVN